MTSAADPQGWAMMQPLPHWHDPAAAGQGMHMHGTVVQQAPNQPGPVLAPSYSAKSNRVLRMPGVVAPRLIAQKICKASLVDATEAVGLAVKNLAQKIEKCQALAASLQAQQDAQNAAAQQKSQSAVKGAKDCKQMIGVAVAAETSGAEPIARSGKRRAPLSTLLGPPITLSWCVERLQSTQIHADG
ncbi:hypothetical protein WJX77_010937 [Trebouxia sp. C0004]